MSENNPDCREHRREWTPALVAEMNRDPTWRAGLERERRRWAEIQAGAPLTPEEEREHERIIEADERWRERFLAGELVEAQQWAWDIFLAFNAHLPGVREWILDRIAHRLCDRWEVVRGTRTWDALCKWAREAQENEPEISRAEMKLQAATAGLYLAHRELGESRKIRLPTPLVGTIIDWPRPRSKANPRGPVGGVLLTDADGKAVKVAAEALPAPQAVAIFKSRAIRHAKETLVDLDDHDEAGPAFVDPPSNPLELAEASERARRADALLSQSDRETVEAIVYGLSVAEIAREQGVTENAIHQRMSRVRARLAHLTN